jgi:phospholipid/cholesterol/gamma-HCH transport system substrate-binding protein
VRIMSDERTAPADDPTKPLTTRKSPRIGKSFSSRNPLPIGAIGLVFLLVLVIAAFNASSLPLIGGGTVYSAEFSESANLQQGDEVRIAGVKVGEVQSVGITGTKVLVKFTVKNGWVGNKSTVYIKLKTLLGAKYVSIDSQGTASQNSHQTMTHTVSPLDVYPAFTKLTDTVAGINTANLAKAFQTLSTDFSGTPKYVKPLVTGLSRLSTTISSRDAALSQLLKSADAVTGTLAARDQDLTKLLSDGNLLLTELNERRDAIHSLLINTQILASQLRGLVADNQKTLNPLLQGLTKVLTLLQNNSDSLERGISLLGPFYRVFNNVIGNGRWFDNYIVNLGVTGVLGTLTGAVTGGKS